MGKRVTFGSSTGPNLVGTIDAPQDEAKNATESFRPGHRPRSFVSLEGIDHLLTPRGPAHRAGRIIGAYLDDA
jgi:hypothetical protein